MFTCVSNKVRSDVKDGMKKCKLQLDDILVGVCCDVSPSRFTVTVQSGVRKRDEGRTHGRRSTVPPLSENMAAQSRTGAAGCHGMHTCLRQDTPLV